MIAIIDFRIAISFRCLLRYLVSYYANIGNKLCFAYRVGDVLQYYIYIYILVYTTGTKIIASVCVFSVQNYMQ